jgi:diguanylate cyclase (GGDEF)-like protein
LRDIDTIARIGGDEFTVILNNLDINEDNSILKAYNIAEKIRSAILLPYILGIESNIEHCCTISIGIVLFKNEETSSVNIIDLADKAMYKAKSIGGNSIRFINHSGDFYSR